MQEIYINMQKTRRSARSPDNRIAVQVLTDIVDEERVHAGEFLRLLKELDPEEEQFYREGAEEVEEEIEKMKK